MLARTTLLCAVTVTTSAIAAASALHRAVIANDLPAIKRVIATQAPEIVINAQDSDGRTALHHAARLAHRQAAEILLKHAAKTKIEDNEGKFPFNHAADNAEENDEHAAVAAIILKAMMGLSGRDDKGWTPLNWAVVSGDLTLVRQLVAEGASVWETRTQNAFEIAVLMEDEEMLAFLIEAGGGANATAKYGARPLTNAAIRGDSAAATVLLRYGAKVNDIDRYGNTPLIDAALRGHLEVVEVLIKNGAEVNTFSKHGSNALIYAAMRGHLELVELLIANGAEVNSTDSYGATALMRAAERKHLGIVKILIKHGARVNVADSRGYTALMLAAQWGHLNLLVTLLDNGAEVNATDAYGSTALVRAARRSNNVEMVRELLQRGAVFTEAHMIAAREIGGIEQLSRIEYTIRQAQTE